MPSMPPSVGTTGECLQGQAATIVGLFNLQVVLAQNNGSWIAQGIEMDYASEGDSLEDVKTRFEDGLTATIQHHFELFNCLDGLIKPTPPEVYLALVGGDGAITKKYSQVTLHQYPIKQIEYIEIQKAA